MTRHFPPPASEATAHAAILIAAARCWREARDAGDRVQPCLYRTLVHHDAEMLAPVFDSLMTLCEAALGRPIAIGAGFALTDDEHVLLDLLDGSKPPRAWLNCPEDTATTLDCAICSTRIMVGLALASRCPHLVKLASRDARFQRSSDVGRPN